MVEFRCMSCKGRGWHDEWQVGCLLCKGNGWATTADLLNNGYSLPVIR